MERPQRAFNIRLSHDVDHPFRYAFSGPKALAKETIHGILHKKFTAPMLEPYRYLGAKYFNKPKLDPFNNFSYLMSIAEKHSIQSCFYFLNENTLPINANYALSHPYIKQILLDISARGHHIGLHGSYETYDNPSKMSAELASLQNTCEALGISQSRIGNRQHFLRWDATITPSVIGACAFAHDSSIGFAEQVGFKSGTCYDYPLYDLKTRKVTQIIERPLHVMEASLFGYMKLNHTASLQEIHKIKQACQLFDGNFNLLWHNSNLRTKDDQTLFESSLQD